MVFACDFIDDFLSRPFSCPLNFPWEFSVAVKWRNLSLMSAASCPIHISWFTLVLYKLFFCIPRVCFCCAYFSALFADRVEWKFVVILLIYVFIDGFNFRNIV